MVRETRYLWVGNLPDKASEEDLAQHFQRYGKIQSVKFISDDGGKAAVVAFMDIKSASKAHGLENKIEGKIVETQYTEASGKGTKVTRTAFDSETVPAANAPPSSRYDVQTPGYEGYGYGSYYSSGGTGREADMGERWSGSGGGGGEVDYYQQQDRGRARQRYPAPQPPPYKAPYSQHKQFEGHYAAYDKYGSGLRAKAGQSPGKPEGMAPRSSGKLPKGYGDSPSRSRSSSSSSCGSHSTSTSRSRRSSSKASKERKRSSVVIPVRKNQEADKLGLLLRGFPPRSSDTSIRDGLFHEYKKCGKVMSVSITGEKENRFAIVTFKKAEDAAKALEQARAKVFFGRKVTAEAHDGVDDSEADYRPPEAELDEYHHKATRTLFVGNLQLDISKETLKDIFHRYGIILDIDIKNQQPNQVFAFVQFDNIKSVVHALHEMDGETIGNSKVKLGFGRSMPTNVLWVDNVTEQVQESYLKRQFCRVGPVNYVLIDRETCRALVFYDSNELAMASLSAMRGRALASKKIQIDFASTQCMNTLMDNMESSGQLRPEDRPDQKGFRQYPPPTTTGEPATYEDRPGYDRSKGFYYEGTNYRGTGGKFRGQYSTRGGRTHYQGYDENYKGKRYEEGYEEGSAPTKYEDFDRELREYGYKQKERSDVEGESPPSYSRVRRYEEYNKSDEGTSQERPSKDQDVMDKESITSYRSGDKKYEDIKYSRDASLEERKREKLRGCSSPNSEYSQRDSLPHRSPSSSPAGRSRRASRDMAHTATAYSPSSPSRHSSPELMSPKKLPKDIYKDKIEQKQDYTPSTTLISEIQRTRPRKHSLKRESESDLSELDKALQRGDLFQSPPKKRQAREEYMDRSRSDNKLASTDYNKKAEREHSGGRKNMSGSHSMDYSGASVDSSYRDDRTKNTPYSVHYESGSRAATAYVEPPEVESKFSTPSPSTKSTKSESDKTPDSSERHSAVSSHSSGEMALLEKEKQRLLSELHDIEEGSASDGEIREEDDEMKSRKKKPRLEEVFDLDWSPSEVKKWREEAIRREKQVCDGQENKEPHPKNSHTEPPPKPPEPPGDHSATTASTGSGKFKPIDSKKSYRKQMEAMRKEHEQDTASRHSQDSKNGEGPSGDISHHHTPTQGPDIEMADNTSMDSSAGKTPRHDSNAEFRKKTGSAAGSSSSIGSDFPKVKGQRSYRTTCTDEMAFGVIDEHHRGRKRDKSEEQKSRRYSDVDKVGKSPSVNRCDSSESKQSAHELDKEQHSRRTSRESSESGRKDGHSTLRHRDRSGESKKSLRSEPCIIPEHPVKGGKDGDKRIPQDPRKELDRRRPSSPMSLPLPKFSKYIKKGVSPKRHSRSHSSPKGQGQSTPASNKMASPLFSPDMSPRRQSRRDSYERSAKTPPSQARTERRIEASVKIASMDKEEELQAQQSQVDIVDRKTVSNLDTLDTNKISSMDTTIESQKSDTTVKSECESVCVKSDNNKDPSDEQWTKPSDTTFELTKMDIEKEIKKELEHIEKETVPNDSELKGSNSSSKELSAETVTEEEVCKPPDVIENKSETKSNLNQEVKEEKVCSEVSLDTNSKGVEDNTEVLVKETSSVGTSIQSAETPVKDCKNELQESPTTKSVPISPSAEKRVSDSDMSDQDSAMLQSFDDCIRALDEKLEQASSLDVRRTPSDSPSGQSTPTLSAPYRDRFKVRKRIDSNASIGSVSSSTVASISGGTDTKGQPSDIVRSLLSRSSIFDQDTKRLEQIDEKYQPKEYNLNLDRPTVPVGVNSEHEDDLSGSSFDPRVKDIYGLTQPKMPQFPSAILKSSVSDGLGGYSTTKPSLSSFEDDTATDGFGLGPSLTLTPPGSSANQDLANKFGPQTLSRYPFLSKKTSLDLSKTSPPPLGMPTTPDPLRSPPILPRDPRRDPTSPPVMVPLSLIRKTSPSSQSAPQSGGPSPLSSPTGILRKSEPGPSILKKSEPTTPTSILKRIESTEQPKSDGFASPPIKRLDDRCPLNNSERTDAQHRTSNDHATDNANTPSGTGNTAVSHIEPEKSMVSKNEFCSGDGVQYQSTPSPPVLTKEVKEATSQGIGTNTPLKRTASQAFLDKADRECMDQSPPTLTQPLQLEEECKVNNIDSEENLVANSSPVSSEPETKKQKVSTEEVKDQTSVEIGKPKEGETKNTSSSSSVSASIGKSTVKVQEKKGIALKKGSGSASDKTDKKAPENKKGNTKPAAEAKKKPIADSSDKKSQVKKSTSVDGEKKVDPRGKETDNKRLCEKKTTSEVKKDSAGYPSKKADSVMLEKKEKAGSVERNNANEKKTLESENKRTGENKKILSPTEGRKGGVPNDKKSGDKVLSDDKKSGEKVTGNNPDKRTTEKPHSGSSVSNEKKSGEKGQDRSSSNNHKASENNSDKNGKTDRKSSETQRKNTEVDRTVKKNSSDKHSSEKKSSPNEKKSEKAGPLDKNISNERKSQADEKKVKPDSDKKSKTPPISSCTAVEKKCSEKSTGDKSKKHDSKAKDNSSSAKNNEKPRHGSDNSNSSSLTSDSKPSQQQKDQKPLKEQVKGTSKDNKVHKPDSLKSEKKPEKTPGVQSDSKNKVSGVSEIKGSKGVSDGKNKVNYQQGADTKTKIGNNSHEGKNKADVKTKSSHQMDMKNKHKSENAMLQTSGNTKDAKTDKGNFQKGSSANKPKVKSDNKSPTSKSTEKLNKLVDETNDKHVKATKTEKMAKPETKVDQKKEKLDKINKTDKTSEPKSDCHDTSRMDKYESKYDKRPSDRVIDRYESKMDRFESTSDRSDKHKDINKNRDKLFSKDKNKQYFKGEERSRSEVWRVSMENKIMKDSRDKHREDKKRLKQEMKEDRKHKSHDKVEEKKTSPGERRRSSSIAGETRELKQLRESLGIAPDQPLQFTSMYDMVKRRTNREAHKDEIFSPEKQEINMKKRRGSCDTSDSGSDEDSDSAFSSENKENKKNQGKSQMKTKTSIMSSSSDEFSSDDSNKPNATNKSSPVASKKTNQRRRKSVVTNSSSQSSNSSADSSDSDIAVTKTPTHASAKRRPQVLPTDSDSVDSDHEAATLSQPVKKPENSPKVNVREVKRNKRAGGKNKIQSSSSESSSESDSDSDQDTSDKRKGQTVLEKLEESIGLSSNEESPSSDSSDSSVGELPPKPAPTNARSKQAQKKKQQVQSARPSSDSEDVLTLKKKSGVKSQKGRNVITTSNSESESDQSSASDRETAKWKNKLKQSPKANRTKVPLEPSPPKPLKKETPPQKSQKQQSPSISQQMHSKTEKSEQVKKKSPAGKQSPKGLRIETDTKKVNKSKSHKDVVSPKLTETKKTVQDKVRKNKETVEVLTNSEHQNNDKVSRKNSGSEMDSKSIKEDSKMKLNDTSEDLNSSNVSDLTEEEKGREEKVSKMLSIFSKSDNIFEKLDFDHDSAKVSSDGELDHVGSEKPSFSEDSADNSPLDSQPEKKDTSNDSQFTNHTSAKLFDSSDSESEVEVKQIAEKILVGGDESQDSEILDQVPLLGSENLDETKKLQVKEESSKKKEVQTSELVKNTVVETERAVNSLVTLLEEVPAPTINETGIVENVEIITEPVDDEDDDETKEECVDQVAQDEVTNAILSISNVMPMVENDPIIQQPQDIGGVHINNTEEEASQIMYQIGQEGNSEAEQAVAALVLDCGFGEKPVEDSYAVAVGSQEQMIPAVSEQAQTGPTQEAAVFGQEQTPMGPTGQTAIVTEEPTEGKEILQSIINEINIVPPEREAAQETVKQENTFSMPVPNTKEQEIKIIKPDTDLKLTSPGVNTKETRSFEAILENHPKVVSPNLALKSPTQKSPTIVSNEPATKPVKEEKPVSEKPCKKLPPPKPGRKHHEAYVPAVSSFEQLFPNIRNETRTKAKEPEAKDSFTAVTSHAAHHPPSVSLPNDCTGKGIPTNQQPKSMYNADVAGSRGMPPMFNHGQHGRKMPSDLYRQNEENVLNMNGPHIQRSEPQHIQKPTDFSANPTYPNQRGQHLLSSPLFQQRDVSFPNRPRNPFQAQPKNMDSSMFPGMKPQQQTSNNFMGLEPQHPKDNNMSNSLYHPQKGVPSENKPSNLSFYNPKVSHQEDNIVNQQSFFSQSTSPKEKVLASPLFYNKKPAEEALKTHLYGQKPGFPPASEPYRHLVVKPPIDQLMQHSSSRQPEPARQLYSQQTIEKKRQNFTSKGVYEKPVLQNSLYELQKERFPIEKPKCPQVQSQSPAKSDVSQERKPDGLDNAKSRLQEKIPNVSSASITNESAPHSKSAVDSLLQSIKSKDSSTASVINQISSINNQSDSKKENKQPVTQAEQEEVVNNASNFHKVTEKESAVGSTILKGLSEAKDLISDDNTLVNKSRKDIIRYEAKSKFGLEGSVETSPIKQIPSEEMQQKPKNPEPNDSEKTDYMIPSTSVPESDTDREKDDDEEAKDNIVYEKEPEKECISIEGLNDFEDEEDLPDLIIDESPLPTRKSTEDETDVKKIKEVEAKMISQENSDMKDLQAKRNQKPSEKLAQHDNMTFKESLLKPAIDNEGSIPTSQDFQGESKPHVESPEKKGKFNVTYTAKLEEPQTNNDLTKTSPLKPKGTLDSNEVSLNVGEKLQGGVLHIVETQSDNLAQPKLSFSAVSLVENTQLPYQSKPPRKVKVKGRRGQNIEMSNTTPLVIETNASIPTPVQLVPSEKALQTNPGQQALLKSPITRGKAKQEDIPVTEPTTPPSSKKKQDSAESPGKFSSRGRKIIPKERGDEITELTRKSRRSASTGSAASDETKVKVKTRAGCSTPVAPENSGEESTAGGVLGKKKTWSLRSKKESEAQDPEPKEVAPDPTDVLPPKEVKEEQKEPPIKITLRRTGRRKTMIQKTTVQDGSVAPEVAEYTKVSEDTKVKLEETPAATEEVNEQPENVDVNQRPKRHRKAKGRKGADSAGPATRTRRNDGSNSPRSKSSEGSSPKNMSKSYVKLEKLNMDSKKDDEDQKDLYEWEDEEEKPLPGYKVARNTRKRKGNDKGTESSQKPDHPKRSKKARAEAKKEAKEALENKEVSLELAPAPKTGVPETQPDKKEPPPLPEPRKPDMTDILQDKRGHLPLKLAMKLKSQEAARKENEAKEAAEKAAREQTEQQNAIGANKLQCGDNNQAKDSFEKSEEARIIDKKRGRFIPRDEQFSPGVKDLSRSGAASATTSASSASFSNRPPSVSTTAAEMPSPKVVSPAIASQQGLTSCRPPSAPSATVTSARSFVEPSQDQAIMRVPNTPASEQFGLPPKSQQEVARSRPSSQPSGAKMSPKPKASVGQGAKADSLQSSHVPPSVGVHPPHILSQSLHSSGPQQLSPHSVRGPSPRMSVPQLPGFSHPFPPSGLPPQTSPTSQASELRAALAQPSKLVQQEQLLHQQRLQERQQPPPQHSPHLPTEASKGSPSLPGLGGPQGIPFSEQHQAVAASAKGVSSNASHSVVSPHIAATHEGVRPADLTSFRPPELSLRDMRNGLPQAMIIPGIPPMFIPGMPGMDPRMLQQHHELIAQQQMLGMLPPHAPPHALLGQHQPPVADRHPHDQSSGSGRPPSRHPTPPTGQPSPRGTPHHPQVSTPLTPQLPQPPIAALPSRPPIAHLSNGLPSDGMAIALRRFPVMWNGYLYLKNDAANVQMHFITGSKQLVTGALESVVEGGIVRIAQRMRLEASQLEGVAKRMQKEEEYSMLVAIPCGKDHVDIIHQSNKLQTGFIQYLQQKQAAGIVNIPVQPGYVVHIFPPCEFSSINISHKAPELVRNLNDNSYLVVVITST